MLQKNFGFLLFLCAICLIGIDARHVDDEEHDRKAALSLCKCAHSALREMQALLADYTRRLTTKNPAKFDDVIGNITEIAYNCTKTPQCRCPDGYFKTNDGNNCLKISEDTVDCNEAVAICSRDPSSRLAVAKDHARLTRLADYIREVDPTDEDFYWIGLSYNKTDDGNPMWTWEDGTSASYDIKSRLKNVRKSLITITTGDESTGTLERVAISKDYQGTHWKQERCAARNSSDKIPRHKYICEFTMFKVNIRPIISKESSGAVNQGRVAQVGVAKK